MGSLLCVMCYDLVRKCRWTYTDCVGDIYKRSEVKMREVRDSLVVSNSLRLGGHQSLRYRVKWG